MKKALCILLALCLLAGLAGCAVSTGDRFDGHNFTEVPGNAPETEKPKPAPTEPAETEPATTEAPETEPPATEPVETEPPATEAPETEPPMEPVYFDANGGEFLGESYMEIPFGSEPEFPEVFNTGYTLARWEPDVDNDGTRFWRAIWERRVLTAGELYDLAIRSVVEIHVFDEDGNYFAQGSGFFVDTCGTIGTNFHVIEGAYSAVALLGDEEYEITTVMSYDRDNDLALVQCDIEESIPLSLNENEVHVGDTVYTLGSSLGLTGTFSDGIVSTASREIDGKDCIQVTAPISHGNSGGPLLNVYGEAIGVNSMTYTEGQNLNFAIKIEKLIWLIETAGPAQWVTFEEMNAAGSGDSSMEYMNDEGAFVFEDCDYAEQEPNDYWFVADPLPENDWIAGYCAPDDADYFSFTLTEDGYITLCLIPYYREDADYLIGGVLDENMEVVVDLYGDMGILNVTENPNDDGDIIYTLETQLALPAGTYYLLIALDDVEYIYDVGAFYELGFSID